MKRYCIFLIVFLASLGVNQLHSQIRRKPITPDLGSQGIPQANNPLSRNNALSNKNNDKSESTPKEIPPIIIKQNDGKKEIIIKKPEKGNITVEGIAQISFGESPIGIRFDELRGRYFASKNMAYRALIGFSMESFNETLMDGKERMPCVTSTQNINAGGGIELHRPGSKHLSPYYGAEGYIIMHSTRMTVSNTRDLVQYEKGYTYFQDSTVSGIYMGAVAGMDYYITSDFYIGTEIRMGFSSVQRSVTSERITLSNNVVSQTNDRSGGGITMGITYVNGIRVGYKF